MWLAAPSVCPPACSTVFHVAGFVAPLATRRQNFLVPPRRHRAFPLVER
jgi:hypothetical protein